MVDDPRTHLHRADALLRDCKYAEAVASYGIVARYYADSGLSLKALGVAQSILQIIDRSAPELVEARAETTKLVTALHKQLRLANDAN